MASKKQNLIKKQNKTKGGLGSVFSNVKAELRKVDWPNKPNVARASFVILIFMVFFTGFVAIVDGTFSKLVLSLKGL